MAKEIYFRVQEDGCILIADAVKIIGKLEAGGPGKYKAVVKGGGTRSLMQNAYYWGVVIPMCVDGFMEFGNEYDSEEVHYFFKAKFHFREIIDFETGEVTRVPLTTTKMTKPEFAEYVEKIRRWAAEHLHVDIPDPDPALAK